MRPVARINPSASGVDNSNYSYYDMSYPNQGQSGSNNSSSYSYNTSSYSSNMPYYQLPSNSSSTYGSSGGNTNYSLSNTNYSGSNTNYSGNTTNYSGSNTHYSGGNSNYSEGITNYSVGNTNYSSGATSYSGSNTSYSGYYSYNNAGTSSGNDYSPAAAAVVAAALTKTTNSNKPYYSSDSTSSYPFTYGEEEKKKSGGYQPWVKRDSLKRPAPYSSGKGLSLMKKMGWRQGQGLGRNEDGVIEPSFPEIKMNKKGLDVSQKKTAEVKVWMKSAPTSKKSTVGTIKIITEGKNPISILEEYCTKRKINTPRYETTVDEGPIHAKNFVFKVSVEGVDYVADTGNSKKREAKQLAAKKCLQELGILPKE